MTTLVEASFNGLVVHFTDDAWFDATSAAAKFGKRVDNWMRLQETKEYLVAMRDFSNASDVREFVKPRMGRNGGTWLHPRLAVAFARWLDPKFGVWCDLQIDALIRGKHPHTDWRRLRHEATASYKVMSEILKLSREADGKSVDPRHFMNEAKLVNWALKGEFKGLDRNGLSGRELDLLAKLEERNAVLIGRSVEYQKRKVILEQTAVDYRAANDPALRHAA
ncbi:MAG: KilA-N domain-containing protein [Sinimarinibacterium flocculans]|uniref:KilA-N domain-containing protein n=1 Tax=Sinimarinibacterium flocculans TaxID=985250 RepID=UPI003C47B4F5